MQVWESHSPISVFAPSRYTGAIPNLGLVNIPVPEENICIVLKFGDNDVVLISMQSFDSKFLKTYTELAPTPLQLEEDLEQLKVLENGYKMKVRLRVSPHFFFFFFGARKIIPLFQDQKNSPSTCRHNVQAQPKRQAKQKEPKINCKAWSQNICKPGCKLILLLIVSMIILPI